MSFVEIIDGGDKNGDVFVGVEVAGVDEEGFG